MHGNACRARTTPLSLPLDSASYITVTSEALKESGGGRKLQDVAGSLGGDVVTDMKSADDLTAALESEATHIEIQAHLNLVDWYWNGNFSDWSAFEIPNSLKSLRVRAPPITSPPKVPKRRRSKLRGTSTYPRCILAFILCFF